MANTLAMQSVVQSMFCGDEVKSVVADLGAATCRLGFGGHESPRHSFRSELGLVERDDDSMDVQESGSSSSKSSSKKKGGSGVKKRRAVLGDMSFRYIRDDIEIEKPFIMNEQGGATINWEHVESVIKYGYGSMHIDPKEYCTLFADNYFESDKDKAKLFELCLESFEQPAIYTMNNSVLASFSAGRQTSMVIDLGATETRVTPVVDGFAVKGGALKTRRGGDWLDNIVSNVVKTKASDSSGGSGSSKKRKGENSGTGITVKPWFEKDEDAIKKYGKCSPSLREMHTMDLIRDIKKWMCFVPYQAVEPSERKNFITNVIQLPEYELPDGSPIGHFDELCTGPEKWFIPKEPGTGVKTVPRPVVGLPAHCQASNVDVEGDSLQEIVRASILGCDVDCRKEVLNNIMLVGGGSLIDGVQQRLQSELKSVFPESVKVKVTSQLPLERTNAAWIGGSILSICGSFQQLWISRQEWLEYGDSLLAHRLKQ